ncbi:cilia- and flagella-associated protein 97 [Aplochiton taeniatus]
MYSPKDLEGQVDHSFFDSDCDDSSFGKDSLKKENSSEGAKSRSHSAAEHPLIQQSNVSEALPDTKASRPKEIIPLRNEEEDNSSLAPAKREEESCSSGPEQISSGSSVTSEEEVVEDGGVSKQEFSSMRRRSSNGLLTASSTDDREEDDDDGYHRSEDESEEDEGVSPSQRLPKSKSAQLGTPKKLLRKTQPQSLSPQSSESGADPETGSSCGSATEGCTPEPPALTRPKTSLPPSSPRARKPRLVSEGPRESPSISPQESEDTVTDVTPLSTPDVSPFQSLDLSLESGGNESENQGLEKRQQEQTKETPQIDLHCNSQETLFTVERRLSHDLVINCPGGRNRKNYSFSNNDVQRIDRENQRLLRELCHPTSRSRAGSTVVGSRVSNLPPVRLYHSALNRQRQQQRIETENMAFLKRLESVKPTPGMRRAEQLADYQQQARYLGTSASLPLVQRPQSKTSASRISSGSSWDWHQARQCRPPAPCQDGIGKGGLQRHISTAI